MTRLKKALGVGAIALALVTNLQYTVLDYGLSTNSLSMPLMAQASTGGGTGTGGSSSGTLPVPVIPQGCGTATITSLTHQTNNAKACNCNVNYTVVLSLNPYKAEVRVAKNRGVENTCSSGEKDDTCGAFGCSSTQTTTP